MTFPKSGKIKVTPEESVIVQTRLFQEGYSWIGGRIEVEHFNNTHFIFWDDSRVSYCLTDRVFNDSTKPEYTMSLFTEQGEDEVKEDCWKEAWSEYRNSGGELNDHMYLNYLKTKYNLTKK